MRPSIDSTGFAWGSVRLQYDHAVRRGNGLDEEVARRHRRAGLAAPVRHFRPGPRSRQGDGAGRRRGMRSASTRRSASGRSNRPDAEFGLQDNDMRSCHVRRRCVAARVVGAGASRTRSRTTARCSGRGRRIPARSSTIRRATGRPTWTRTSTPFTASSTCRRSPRGRRSSSPTTYVRRGAQYLYLVPANSTLAPPQQLPPVRNANPACDADVPYTLTRHTSVGAGYAYDKYDVDDLPRHTPQPGFPTLVSLMYQWRPYTATGVRAVDVQVVI